VRLVEIVDRADSASREELIGFVEQLGARLGARPLSDHLWLDLRSGGGEGSHSVRVADADGTIALAHISAANDGSVLEVVVDPTVADVERIRDDAAETVVDHFRRRGGGTLAWWLDDPDEHDEAIVEQLGLLPWRTLHEMRRPLPHELHATVDTRAFVPGVDDDAWLSVNNRAFAEHGEQGGWTHETLDLRLAEPWFDPDGFRIHEIDGRLAAFCWTKIHDDTDPVLGEIYVIAVDPDFHGRGLGRQLTLAGLDSISARGITAANLYVDGDNTAAVSLYEQLGFTIHRTRRAFRGTLASRA
jgi:mycothiol synthase